MHLPEAPSVFPKIIDNNSNVPITGATEKNQNISGTSVNKSKLLSSATFNLLVRAAQIYVSICYKFYILKVYIAHIKSIYYIY